MYLFRLLGWLWFWPSIVGASLTALVFLLGFILRQLGIIE